MAPSPRTRPLESQRIALHREILLRFPDFDGFVAEYSANISMTGMFVRSQQPHPPGTPVQFEFRLADGMELIQGSGWVVWVRAGDEGDDLPAGMGIEFSEISGDSRRLIRWIILHQLPEGARPFRLDEHDPGRDAAAEPSDENRGGRGRAWGAALVVAIAVVALLVWMRVGGEGELGPVQTRPPPLAASSSAPAASPALGMLETASWETAISPAEVEDTVLAWADAWSAQDVATYLSFYGAEFETPGGMPREAWEARRRDRLRAPSRVFVGVTALEVELLDEERARATFTQAYRSDRFSDVVRKRLDLVRQARSLKIRREEIVEEKAGS